MYSHEPKRPRWILIAVVAVVIILALFFIFGGHKDDKKAAGGPGSMPPANVTVITVAPSDQPVTFEYAGRTAGFREIEIRARVGGILLKRDYQEGQLVHAGDVLFEIDPAPSQAALAQAEATFKQTERDWNRVTQLFQQKALSARERDQALSAYEQAKAQLKTARINLNFTRVIAPITGVASSEAMSEGSLVVADQSLLTRLTQLDPLYVNFAYPDTEAMQQRRDLASGKLSMPEDKKLKAQIRFGDGTTYPTEGDVDFTDSVIDEQTGSVRARALLPDPDGSLLPGQFVRVIVKGFVRKNAVAIPDQAVIQGPQGAMVYVVDKDKKAQIRPVTLGPLSGKIRIVETGLNEGDVVITEGMIKTMPGSAVNPKEASDAPADAPAQPGAAAAPGSDAPASAAPAASAPATDDSKVLMKDQPATTQPNATPPSSGSAPATTLGDQTAPASGKAQ